MKQIILTMTVLTFIIGMNNGISTKAEAETPARMQPYYTSWASSAFLDHRHGEQGVACKDCHDTALPESTVKKEKCFTCHGSYTEIADQSPFHNNALYPHYVSEALECDQCHKAHEASVLVCNLCHIIDKKVP